MGAYDKLHSLKRDFRQVQQIVSAALTREQVRLMLLSVTAWGRRLSSELDAQGTLSVGACR